MTNATVQPQEQGQAHNILAPVQADDKVKADAWEIYQNSEGQDFEKKLGALSLPQETKAALWNAKASSAARKPTQSKTEQPSTLEKADKGITGVLETNPENLKSTVRTNAIEVPKTLGQELYGGAKSVVGIVPSMYHALADEPTAEEKAQYAADEKAHGEAPGTETSGLKRIGLAARGGSN